MNLLVSNSPHSAGYLYSLVPGSVNMVKYYVSGETFSKPISAAEFAPLFFKWVLDSKNSSEYLKTCSVIHKNSFISSAVRNALPHCFIKFKMEDVFQYIVALDYEMRGKIYLCLRNYITQNFNVSLQHKEMLYDLLSFTWMRFHSVYGKPEEDKPTMNPDENPDDEMPWGDYTLHPRDQKPTNPKTAAKGNTAMTDKDKLFKFINSDGKEVFCTYLATDSTGKWVVETKGTGDVFSADKDKLEEVVPFTVTLYNPLDGREAWFNLQGDTSILKQGMVLITETGSLWMVKKVNSKVKTVHDFDPTKWSVVPTTPLVQASTNDDNAAK